MSFLFKGLIFRFHFNFWGENILGFPQWMSGWVYLSSKCYWVWLGKGGQPRESFHGISWPWRWFPKMIAPPTKMDLPLKCPNLKGKQQSVRVSELPSIIYHENWFKLFPPYTPSSQIGNPRLSYISGRDGEEWANLDEKNANDPQPVAWNIKELMKLSILVALFLIIGALYVSI